jgi:hypothetical protein
VARPLPRSPFRPKPALGFTPQDPERSPERIGDHAVEIGERTAFLVTGEFREFTDAASRATDDEPEP